MASDDPPGDDAGDMPPGDPGPGEPMPDAGSDGPPPTVLPRSCKELLDHTPTLANGAYTLGTSANARYQAYCDMTAGGWTLALKVDGMSGGARFGYDDPLWTNADTYLDTRLDASHHEAKYRAFSEVPVSRIRLVMEEHSIRTLTFGVTGSSLLAVMRGPFVALDRTRFEWMTLLDSVSLQPDCNRGGINNFVADPYFRVRIGMLANFGANCDAPDSFIGVGAGGGPDDGCYHLGSRLVVPVAGSLGGGTCTATPSAPPPANRAAFASIYVQ